MYKFNFPAAPVHELPNRRWYATPEPLAHVWSSALIFCWTLGPFSLCDSQVSNVTALRVTVQIQGIDQLPLLASFWWLLSREEGGGNSFFFAKIRKFYIISYFTGVENRNDSVSATSSSSFPWLRQNSEEKSCVAISHLFFGWGFALGQTGQVSSKQ